MALRPNVVKLKDLLLKAKVVDEFQMRAALGRLEQWGGRLPGVIVDMGFCDDDTMLEALSTSLKVPVAHLGMVPRDGALLAKVEASFCEEYGVFPISLQNRTATIAFADPTELDVVDLLSSKLGARVQMVLSPESEIRAAIGKHYRGQAVPATQRKDNRARDAHIAATQGEVFELDTTAPPKPGEEPAPAISWRNKSPSANTLLDEFLEDEPKQDGLSAAEVKKLEGLMENQRKATAILNAVQALLAEKGFVR